LIVKRSEVLFHRTAVDRFLALLPTFYQLPQDKFSRVLGLGGRRRAYFAPSLKELEAYGSSTQPKRIPGTPYYVVTNNDTPKKQGMLRDVMERLDYSPAEAKAIAALVDPKADVPSFGPAGSRKPDADDPLKTWQPDGYFNNKGTPQSLAAL
jgi:hypothetical protein